MRKGEARRQEIVKAAEKLFYMNGYENTSIQDILLETGISKGGFYHHFASKSELLEEICVMRVEESYERTKAAVEACDGDAVRKFNLLFDEGGFFGADEMEFIRLMIRVIYQDGCVQLRDMMQRKRVEKFEPLLTRIIHEGLEKGIFFTAFPDNMGRLILMMDNALTDELSGAMAAGQENTETVSVWVELLGAYRSSVERVLEAPYGSIRLIGLERIVEILRSME